MFLVGGYSQSSWLQEKITERFSDRLKIIIPDSAFVSVLRGAVMYELNRSDMPAYKAKHSYAVGIIKPFIDDKHPIGKIYKFLILIQIVALSSKCNWSMCVSFEN